MGMGPAPATRKVLEVAGLELGDVDVIELNEAFAAQGLAVLRDLGLDDDAENVAEEFQIRRDDQDAFALRSQQRAVAAQASGRLAKEIVPVTIPRRKGEPIVVERDEHPRADSSLEKLAKLPTPFRDGGTVTAGNASGVNDGACALIVASAEGAKAHGLEPKARVVAMAHAGVPPRIMGMGPAPATRKVLEVAGLELGDVDVIELNEAFAAQGRRRRRARQPQRRRHRPRSPPGHERRPARHHRPLPARRDGRALRALHHVHRRRPGHRHGPGAGVDTEPQRHREQSIEDTSCLCDLVLRFFCDSVSLW
jgi:acetyl-CoA acetyltransferase